MERTIKNVNFLLGCFILITIFLGCSNMSERKPLGSKSNPIKFYFTPSGDAENISQNSIEFVKFLEEETGYFFKTAVPISYIAVVEAFGTKKCDIAIINSFGYLLAHQRYGVEALLRIIRYGESVYRGQIIAHVNSGINKIKDIHGKKFAFVDPSSTSGYLLPLKIFKENHIQPKETVFAMKHDNVVTMIYQRQVDAGATFYSPPTKNGKIRDARARVMTQFPDVAEKIKIIKITDPISNDPIAFRRDLPENMKHKIIKAILKFMETETGKKTLYNIYSVDGFIPTTDKDYESLRNLLDTIGKGAEEFIEK
ncbi:MAG: phosphate/phosphite/phosphonate ABC transporter substrate-binding protein [bacterium]